MPNGQLTEKDYEIRFSQEWDEIAAKHANTLPTTPTPRQRYAYFKSYIGQWYFLIHKSAYLKKDLGRNDIVLLNSIISRLDEVRKSSKIDTPEKKKLLLEKAITCVQDSASGDFDFFMINNYRVYLGILHEQRYFDNLSIPDDYLDIAPDLKKVEAFGDFYGEYFLLYDYLNDRLNKLTKQNKKLQGEINTKVIHRSALQELYRIRIENHEIIIFEGLEKQIKLPALMMTLYLFFLSREEGVSRVSLGGHANELVTIYKLIRPGSDDTKARSSIASLVQLSAGGSFDTYVSKIKNAFSEHLPSHLIENYIISGKRNGKYSISLPKKYRPRQLF